MTVLLALHWWLGVSAWTGQGITGDETAHLVGGYSYWRFDDYRLQPENGNLPQRWGALPLLLMHPRPRLDPAAEPVLWGNSHVWRIGEKFLFGSGNDADYLFLCARSMMALWSVAAGLLVFFWSRRLWGDQGGLLTLGFYVVSPTVLANGPLVTSDMCAAFWLLAATGAWWRVCHKVTWTRLSVSCAATGLAFVSKFSAVLLPPIFILLIVWRAAEKEPLSMELGTRCENRRMIASTAGKLGALVTVLVVHGLVTWAIIWTFFGWRYSAFAPGLPPAWKFYVPWAEVMPQHGLAHAFFIQARSWHLLPEAYLQGFAYVLTAAQARGAFLLGQYGDTGWWWFFPYAFLAKSSLGELLATLSLILIAALSWTGLRSSNDRWIRVREDLHRLAPLLVFAGVYWAAAMHSHLNIGQRHILPTYLVLFITFGALVGPGAKVGRRLLAVLLVGIAAFESFWVRPYYLAFFNLAVGGPSAGWHQLVDSSLDWGQGLPELAAWLRQHRRPDERVYISYFGTDDPFYEGIAATELSPYYAYGRQRRWVELHAGIYCVSATMLQDVYSVVGGAWTMAREDTYVHLRQQMRSDLAAGKRSPVFAEFGTGPNAPLWSLDRLRFARLCLYLRVRRPDTVIGYNQFVFRLDAREVHVVVDGTLKQLTAMMEQAAKASD